MRQRLLDRDHLIKPIGKRTVSIQFAGQPGILKMAMSVYERRKNDRFPDINHRLTVIRNQITATANSRDPVAANPDSRIADDAPFARPNRP